MPGLVDAAPPPTSEISLPQDDAGPCMKTSRLPCCEKNCKIFHMDDGLQAEIPRTKRHTDPLGTAKSNEFLLTLIVLNRKCARETSDNNRHRLSRLAKTHQACLAKRLSTGIPPGAAPPDKRTFRFNLINHKPRCTIAAQPCVQGNRMKRMHILHLRFHLN